jgi:hypothetical protein
MTNRNLLEEAIADAKAIKATAIANAKAALEESFAPHFNTMIAAKLQEMESEDESMNEVEYEEDGAELEEKKSPKGFGKVKVVDDYTDDTLDELEELLNEMDPSQMGFGDEEEEESDDFPLDFDEIDPDDTEDYESEEEFNYGDDEVSLYEAEEEEEEEKEEEEEEEGDEEEVEVGDMSEEDLKNMIEDVIKDMIASGEIEKGHEGMENEEGEEKGEELEEIDLNEILSEMENLEEYAEASEAEMLASICQDYPEHHACKNVKEAKNMKKEEELEEAFESINTLRSELNEVNLLNAKLLYTNKIFRAKNLTEAQKVKVLATFDKATSKKEAQLIYETLIEGLKPKKTAIKENLGRVSKPAGLAPTKKPILESNDMVSRWQKLAGII